MINSNQLTSKTYYVQGDIVFNQVLAMHVLTTNLQWERETISLMDVQHLNFSNLRHKCFFTNVLIPTKQKGSRRNANLCVSLQSFECIWYTMDSSSQRGCSQIIIILWPACNQWLKVQAYGCPKLKLQVCKNEIHQKKILHLMLHHPFFPRKAMSIKVSIKIHRIYTILIIPIYNLIDPTTSEGIHIRFAFGSHEKHRTVPPIFSFQDSRLGIFAEVFV